MLNSNQNDITEINSSQTSKKLNSINTTLLWSFLGGIFVVKALVLPFVTPALRKICIPFVPATQDQLRNIGNFLNKCSGPLIDLGSGDGRIVFEAAKRGLVAHGVEINLWLVLYSRFLKFIGNTTNYDHCKNIKFFHKSMWHFPLQPYKTVVVFGVGEMTTALQSKIYQEFKGRHIITCRVPLFTDDTNGKTQDLKKNIQLVSQLDQGVNSIWLYEKK